MKKTTKKTRAKTKTATKSNSFARTAGEAAGKMYNLGAEALSAVQQVFTGKDEEFASLNGLLVNELQDLYSAEKQLVEALPKMRDKATNPQLKKAFAAHLKQTQNHVKRLEETGKILRIKLQGKSCKAMEGLIKEGDEVLKGSGTPELIDSALIGCAQRVEHYEIAAYGCTRTMAKALSLNKVVKLLQSTLDEEGATDKGLTKIAETSVFPALMKKSSKSKGNTAKKTGSTPRR